MFLKFSFAYQEEFTSLIYSIVIVLQDSILSESLGVYLGLKNITELLYMEFLRAHTGLRKRHGNLT